MSETFIPPNLPFADSPEEVLVVAKPRRAGRTLRARLARMMPTRAAVEEPAGEYCFQEGPDGLTLARKDESGGYSPAAIDLPSSLKEKLADLEIQQELLDFIGRIRQSLSRKEDYKLHLDKEAPSYVTLAYSFQGRPTKHLSIDPARVDISQEAFSGEKEHESFFKAVAQQNFNNVAYKRWREQYKNKFVDDVIAHELWDTYGNPAERDLRMEQHRAIERLHAMRRGEEMTSEQALEAIMAMPEVQTASEPMVSAPKITILSDELINAIRQSVVQSAPEVSTPEMIEQIASTIADEVVSNPAVQQDYAVSAVADLPQASELQAPDAARLRAVKARYDQAREDFEYYTGPLGDLVCSINGVDPLKVRAEYASASSEYLQLLESSRLAMIDQYLLGSLQSSEAQIPAYSTLAAFVRQSHYRDQLPTITIARLFTPTHRQRLLRWLEREEPEVVVRQQAAQDLLASTLSGVAKTGLLGVPIMQDGVSSLGPAAVARIAHLLGRDGADYSSLWRARGLTDKGMTDNQEVLRTSLCAHELDSLLAGGGGVSSNPYSSGYRTDYARLCQAYRDMIGGVDMSAPDTQDSDAAASFYEPRSDARIFSSATENTDSSSDQSHAHYKLLRFLDECTQRGAPRHWDELEVLSKIAELSDDRVTPRAKRLLSQWHTDGSLRDAGILSLELGRDESLFAGLQSMIRGHEDYFPQLEGSAVWQKASRALSDIHYTHDMGELSDDTMQWIDIGKSGDLICYSPSGQIRYCRIG